MQPSKERVPPSLLKISMSPMKNCIPRTQNGVSELDACISDSEAARSGLYGAIGGVSAKYPIAGALRVLRRAQ